MRQNRLFAFIPLPNIASYPSREYEFSFEELNKALIPYSDYDGFGIIHSHVIIKKYNSDFVPSREDKSFFAEFAKSNPDIAYLYFPIVSRTLEGELHITWYRRYPNGELAVVNVELVEDAN